ncbi:hypothetical protein [Agrobacterium pusense]|uniref:hypothetical protein n=1 Tax=Agrobacterium pusense TaxID=648995 RepID=UPI0028A7A5CD|nr:hypothetical protein [Agrobacterium pusense]
MKRLLSVVISPLARRFGALAASGMSGAMIVDPALAARVEAWVAAGVLLLADLVLAHSRAKTQEGR